MTEILTIQELAERFKQRQRLIATSDYPGRALAGVLKLVRIEGGLARSDPSMARALAVSSFARTLHKALMADAEREIELALRVAYGLEAGLRADDIAARLGVDRGDVLAAAKRVQRARTEPCEEAAECTAGRAPGRAPPVLPANG
jgi:hypothetical protein